MECVWWLVQNAVNARAHTLIYYIRFESVPSEQFENSDIRQQEIEQQRSIINACIQRRLLYYLIASCTVCCTLAPPGHSRSAV